MKHILVANGNSEFSLRMADALKGAGYETHTVTTGEEAVAVLKNEPFDRAPAAQPRAVAPRVHFPSAFEGSSGLARPLGFSRLAGPQAWEGCHGLRWSQRASNIGNCSPGRGGQFAARRGLWLVVWIRGVPCRTTLAFLCLSVLSAETVRPAPA